MPALKEIFAHFGITVDGKPLQTLDQGVSGVMSKLDTLGRTLAAGAVVQGLRSLVGHTAEAADELGKSAGRLGFQAQELQAWRYAAGLADVSAQDLEASFQKLNLAQDAAKQGGKTQAAAFKTLGVSYKDAHGNLRPVAEMLPEIADGLAKIQDPATRSGLAVDLLGRSGTKLVPLLSEGAEGLAKYRKEMEALGGGFQDELIEQSAEYNDNLTRMDFAVQSLNGHLVLNLLPTLTRLAETSAKLVSGIGWLIEKTNLLKAAGIAIVAWTAKWAAGLLLANGSVLIMAGGIALAVLALEELYTLFTGGKSVIGDFLDEMRPLGMDAQEWVAGLTGVWQEFIDVLETAWEVGKGVVGLLSGESAEEAGRGVVAMKQKIADREKAERAARLGAPQAKDAAKAAAVKNGGQEGVAAFMAAGGTFEEFKAQRLKGVNSGAFEATDLDRSTFGKELVTARAGKVQAKGSAAKGSTVVNNGPVNVTAQLAPGTTAQQANEIARIAAKEMDKRQRAAHAALREEV